MAYMYTALALVAYRYYGYRC